MSKPRMGARVLFCGHKGTFVADIFKVGNVNVVRANGKVDPASLNRDLVNKPPTHRMSDLPEAGFWRPDLGVFVVPQTQVKEVAQHET
jgi:hypothetical protein